MKQANAEKGVDHHAILDLGNRIGSKNPIEQYEPMIIHQTPPHITREPVRNSGLWQLVSKIENEAAALQRLRAACSNPFYGLLHNNCEHFARYIAIGVRESHQLQIAGFAFALFGFALVAAG